VEEFKTNFKKGPTSLRLAKQSRRREIEAYEEANKATTRRRDKRCRFPRCGCQRLGVALKAQREVSHERHKGMGGDPGMVRSEADIMILLCRHRHQDAVFSRAKGTLRAEPLTPIGFDGPLRWMVDTGCAADTMDLAGVYPETVRRLHLLADQGKEFVVLAVESAIGVCMVGSDWQEWLIDELAKMEL